MEARAGGEDIRAVSLRRADDLLKSHPGYAISPRAQGEIDSILNGLQAQGG